jgi:hypothetical protein
MSGGGQLRVPTHLHGCGMSEEFGQRGNWPDNYFQRDSSRDVRSLGAFSTTPRTKSPGVHGLTRDFALLLQWRDDECTHWVLTVRGVRRCV